MSSLQFKDRSFTAEEIKEIAAQTKLLGLSFQNCPITDEDIAQLCELPKLVNLSFEYLSRLPSPEVRIIPMERNNL